VNDKPSVTLPVEAGAILCFARAVGYPDPPGDYAPPTFVQASAHFDPDMVYRPKPGEPWMGSGSTPSGTNGVLPGSGGAPVLHAEQSFEYHRPVRVGDVLVATEVPGKQWTKEGRSGRLDFTETVTELRDEQGELVVTSRSVAVVATPNAEAGEG
jgi:hypothetical protein